MSQTSDQPEISKTVIGTDSLSSSNDVTGGSVSNEAEVENQAHPKQIGKYRLDHLLGQGGMGAVYLAFDEKLQRQVALKIMLPKAAANPTAKERFLREARAAACISNDHVVGIYEADEQGNIPFIALQYLKGYSLDEYLKRKGNLGIQQIVRIGRETALGLASAHNLGMVHRDIKPGNIWLEAPNGRVKILDFGLAKPVQEEGVSELTASGAVVGTPSYMAPEQGQGLQCDGRADLFSLGVMLYRLCTGQLPFQRPTLMATLLAIASDEPTPILTLNPSVPESFVNLIQRLMAKKPENRPANAEQVAQELLQIEKAIKGELQLVPSGHANNAHTAIPITVNTTPINPFADIDIDDETESVKAPPSTSPNRKKSDAKITWVLMGFAFFLLVVVAGVIIIIIKNKDGTQTKIEVPDDSTVEVIQPKNKDKDKDKPQPLPEKTTTQKVAAAVLKQGGILRLNAGAVVTTLEKLPASGYMIEGIVLHTRQDIDKMLLTDLCSLEHLNFLDLDEMNLNDMDLKVLKDCRRMRFISVRKTKITAKGLEELHQLRPDLRIIHDGGVIDSSDPERSAAEYALSIGGQVRVDGNAQEISESTNLPKERFILTGINLESNPLATDAGLLNFKDCKGLKRLHLYKTNITDAGLAHFKNCTELTYLELGYTGVTDKGLAYFKDCKSLKHLSMDRAKITDEGLANFKDCKELAHLAISYNGITDAGLAHFKDCKMLKEVYLVLDISDRGLAYLKDSKGITHLYLSSAKITDTGFAHFKDCKQLKELSLGGTTISDEGLTFFKDCKELTYLNVKHTKVTAKGLQAFQKALPGCKIDFDGEFMEPKK